MSSCYKTSNNKYFNLPPRMDDARHFTDYRPNSVVNNNLKNENKTVTAYEYRMFLIRNAKKIMDVNKKLSYIHNGTYNCDNKYSVGTMLPEKEKILCNIQTCDVIDNYDKGIGLGRKHEIINECIKPGKENEFSLEENLCQPKDRPIDESLYKNINDVKMDNYELLNNKNNEEDEEDDES